MASEPHPTTCTVCVVGGAPGRHCVRVGAVPPVCAVCGTPASCTTVLFNAGGGWRCEHHYNWEDEDAN